MAPRPKWSMFTLINHLARRKGCTQWVAIWEFGHSQLFCTRSFKPLSSQHLLCVEGGVGVFSDAQRSQSEASTAQRPISSKNAFNINANAIASSDVLNWGRVPERNEMLIAFMAFCCQFTQQTSHLILSFHRPTVSVSVLRGWPSACLSPLETDTIPFFAGDCWG